MDKVAVLDLDDTLIDLIQSMTYAFNKEIIGKSHWTEFHDLVEEYDIHHEEFKRIALKHEVAAMAQPYLFAKSFLYDLKNLGYYIAIVTARGGFMENPYEFTADYLKKHNMIYDELIVTQFGENKVDSLGQFDTIDLAVDDNIGNCIDFIKSGKIQYIFLPALPWNKKHPDGMIRIHNLYQVFHHMGIDL